MYIERVKIKHFKEIALFSSIYLQMASQITFFSHNGIRGMKAKGT